MWCRSTRRLITITNNNEPLIRCSHEIIFPGRYWPCWVISSYPIRRGRGEKENIFNLGHVWMVCVNMVYIISCIAVRPWRRFAVRPRKKICYCITVLRNELQRSLCRTWSPWTVHDSVLSLLLLLYYCESLIRQDLVLPWWREVNDADAVWSEQIWFRPIWRHNCWRNVVLETISQCLWYFPSSHVWWLFLRWCG